MPALSAALPACPASAFMARGLARALVVAAIAWLCAWPGTGKAQAAAAAARTAADPVLEIQRTLRGRPERALAALQPLIAQSSGPDLVAGLVLQARMCDLLPDDACVERAAARLDSLGHGGKPSSAAAMALLVRALPVARHGPLGRADRLLGQAGELLPADADERLRLTWLMQRSEIKRELGKYDEELALAQQAVQLSDQMGLDWARAESRVELAYGLSKTRQPDLAQATAESADEIARAADDLYAQFSVRSLQALLATAAGREDEDLRLSREAIRLARASGDMRRAALAMANLSDHYLRIGDNATALALAREALPIARQVHNEGGEAVALANAGFALIHLGQVGEGTGLVRQSLAMFERSGEIDSMADIQHELGDGLEQAGRLPEALAALREYRRLADESFRREQQQAVLELEESFDAERRRNALSLLRTETGLKQAQLLSHDLQVRVWAVAIASGLLLLALAAELLRRMRRNTAQLQSSNALLKLASESDPLTALANRRHFRTLVQARAGGGEAFEGALILVDLDHFKHINDRHGHAAGDAVLVEVARRLRQALREGDLAVRWGGEEFLVVLRPMPAEQTRQLAERLLTVIGSESVAAGSERIPVTASIGFASFPLPEQGEAVHWERAIDLVDQAMYFAKSHGRNRACGVVRLSPVAAALAGGGGPEALLSAWRGGQAELDHLVGPAGQQAGRS